MPQFKQEFEMRRVIFGLVSILRCPINLAPMLIQSRITDLFKTTNDLVLRQYNQRLETVTDNEKSIREEMEAKQNGDGFEDEDIEEDDDDNSDDMDETIKKLQKFKNGMPEEEEEDGSESDEEDSDYDLLGGDMCLYDSRLDEIDELLYMQETIEVLY
jgi:hypothetical protein